MHLDLYISDKPFDLKMDIELQSNKKSNSSIIIATTKKLTGITNIYLNNQGNRRISSDSVNF